MFKISHYFQFLGTIITRWTLSHNRNRCARASTEYLLYLEIEKRNVYISACSGQKVSRTRRDDSSLYLDVENVLFEYISIFVFYAKMRSRRTFGCFLFLFCVYGSLLDNIFRGIGNKKHKTLIKIQSKNHM